MKPKGGTFLAGMLDGPMEWPYVSEFEWKGHAFVIHKGIGHGYRVSHKASGSGAGFGGHRTQKAAREATIAGLEKHPRRCLRKIREAEARG